jgi:hypothetical protein
MLKTLQAENDSSRPGTKDTETFHHRQHRAQEKMATGRPVGKCKLKTQRATCPNGCREEEITNAGEEVEKSAHTGTVGENKNWSGHSWTSLTVPSTSEEQPRDPAAALLDAPTSPQGDIKACPQHVTRLIGN